VTLLLRGGIVLDEQGRRRADVMVDSSTIVAVEPGIAPRQGATVLDCGGCIVAPGLVDLQVHLREPGGEAAETIDTGSQAAALGGFTAVVSMANTNPTIDSVELVRFVQSQAAAAGWCDVFPAAAISLGRKGEQLVDFTALHAAGVRLFTDDGDALMDSALMRAAFEATLALPGAYIGQHAEDCNLVRGGHIHEGDVSRLLRVQGRPAEAEEVVVARDLALARLTGARYHVLHVSTAEAVALIGAAKAAGVRVTTEVTPQHLVLTDEALTGGDALFKMNPPLRPQRHQDALRAGLRSGVIDAIATDHAPHPHERKAVSIPDASPGMTGLETALAAVLTNDVLPLDDAVAAMSWKPARIHGMDGHGGPIAPGARANLCVIDPDATWTVDVTRLGSRSHNNPFRATTLHGQVRHTIRAGRPVVIDATLAG
jgi:dihydroorotase